MTYRQCPQVPTAMVLHPDFLPGGCSPGTLTCREERKPAMLIMTILLPQSIGGCIQCQLLLFTSPYLLLILGSQTKFPKAFSPFVNHNMPSVRIQAENRQAVKLSNLNRV